MNTSHDPLRLATLAQPKPLVDGWLVIAAALQRRRMVRRQLSWAATAVVAVAVGVYFQLPGPLRTSAPAHAPGLVQTREVAQQTAVKQVHEQTTGDRTAGQSLAVLVGLSQELESTLSRARARVAVMPAQSLVYQVELEDLVAQVDEAINQNPESLELWSQRVNLLLDLNQIYRKELRRDYSNVASL